MNTITRCSLLSNVIENKPQPLYREKNQTNQSQLDPWNQLPSEPSSSFLLEEPGIWQEKMAFPRWQIQPITVKISFQGSCSELLYQTICSSCGFHGSVSCTPLGNLLEMQILGPLLKPATQTFWGEGLLSMLVSCRKSQAPVHQNDSEDPLTFRVVLYHGQCWVRGKLMWICKTRLGKAAVFNIK